MTKRREDGFDEIRIAAAKAKQERKGVKRLKAFVGGGWK